MREIMLDTDWELFFYNAQQFQLENPDQLRQAALESIPATVPGNVEIDLQQAGLLEDPFWGENIVELRKLEYNEWWYTTSFEVPMVQPGQQLRLVFKGVDCFATYWLNDQMIGQSDNMLIEHSFDITDLAQPGEPNTLHIRLRSPREAVLEKGYSAGLFTAGEGYEALWARKAPHMYGWDIMPRAVSAGLWRPVVLQIVDAIDFEQFYIYTHSLARNSATLGVFFQINQDVDIATSTPTLLRIEAACGDKHFTHEQPVRFMAGSFTFEVENPGLWWPRGYGEANLYDLNISLVHDDTVLAQKQMMFGIRTVKLERTDITTTENPGEFLFYVNNTRIYCRGTNWVPLDALHSRDASRYEEAIRLAVEVGCNMIRCWGGNVYEDTAFFNLCDREGLMVWQDFALACAAYPQTDDFKATITDEFIAVIRKLRNHASLVLWCGDNENDAVAFQGRNLDPRLNSISRDLLPKLTFQEDPYRAYLPSSPYIAPAAGTNLDLMPESHLWGPRDYYKSTFYTGSNHHFVSEIGYHGCPNLSSLQKFLDEEHLWPWQDNEWWIYHATASFGKSSRFAYRIPLMANQIRELFGVVPDTLEDFILASQISQAEAKKFFVESGRIRKWRTTGVLWWNLLDGWPQFSDAVIDYYFGKKLAYYYIMRSQQLVCVMANEPSHWHSEIVLVNDTLQMQQGSYRVWDADSQDTLLAGDFCGAANANTILGEVRVSRGVQQMMLMEWTIDGQKSYNHYLVGTPPIALEQYRHWLSRIAVLDGVFDAKNIGK
ncbi:MAG: glycoside hydrolase family 2 [Anaerolineae bacterium]|nr:glycoside hydrolase family 2 [Anaerolineae bacterium]